MGGHGASARCTGEAGARRDRRQQSRSIFHRRSVTAQGTKHPSQGTRQQPSPLGPRLGCIQVHQQRVEVERVGQDVVADVRAADGHLHAFGHSRGCWSSRHASARVVWRGSNLWRCRMQWRTPQQQQQPAFTRASSGIPHSSSRLYSTAFASSKHSSSSAHLLDVHGVLPLGHQLHGFEVRVHRHIHTCSTTAAAAPS